MKVIDEALKLGACDKIDKANNLRQAAALFFSPQGREFCLEHNYPSLEVFRSLGDLRKYNVFVDTEIEIENENVALINSHGELIYTEGYHKVILMHGATANIKVGEVATVTVEGEGGTVW